jgi:hypothetical protein
MAVCGLLRGQGMRSRVIFFISSRTGMTVKRPTPGAEGFVLIMIEVRSRLTSMRDLMEQFRTLRGYDLPPYLPALIGDAGPLTASVRRDWGRTHRSQTYGFPPVTLSSNQPRHRDETAITSSAGNMAERSSPFPCSWAVRPCRSNQPQIVTRGPRAACRVRRNASGNALSKSVAMSECSPMLSRATSPARP